MSVMCSSNQERLLLCKGAPESIINRCAYALVNSPREGPGGQPEVVAMNQSTRRALLERMAQYGGKGVWCWGWDWVGK